MVLGFLLSSQVSVGIWAVSTFFDDIQTLPWITKKCNPFRCVLWETRTNP